MLWRRKKTEPPASSMPPDVSDADKALDTVAAFLRAYGEHAFDTENCEADELRDRCEDWAKKILVGGGRAADEADDEGPAPSVPGRQLQRDWGGVRRFVQEHRREEHEYVARSLGNLRSTIRDFARCLSTAVQEDQASDDRVASELGDLASALEAHNTEKIRDCAARVVTTVRSAIEKRRSRETEQIQVLGERLQNLKSELSEVREQATMDALTKVYNRAAFDQQLEKLCDLGMLFGHAPALLLLDVDHFKAINDRYGHPAGDEVLRQLGNTLMRTFLRKQDFVCRYGGEEFGVLLVDTSLEGAQMLAERLLNAVRDLRVQHDNSAIEVTVSIGVAAVDAGESSTSWLERADKALYRAKQAGRDQLVMADSSDAPRAACG